MGSNPAPAEIAQRVPGQPADMLRQIETLHGGAADGQYVEVSSCEGDPRYPELCTWRVVGWFPAWQSRRIAETITVEAAQRRNCYVSLTRHPEHKRNLKMRSTVPGSGLTTSKNHHRMLL